MSVLEGGVEVIKEDVPSKVIAAFKKKDEVINHLFDKLQELQLEYTDDNQKNLNITLSMEYILMKLRIHVTSEIAVVKSLLVPSDVNSYLRNTFNKRLDYLVTVNSKLTELRDDFNSIQKLSYTLKIQPGTI